MRKYVVPFAALLAAAVLGAVAGVGLWEAVDGPDGPRLLGFWRVQLGNVYYYKREVRNGETVRKFAADIPEDGWDRAVFSRGWMGLAIGIGLLCAALGVGPGLVAAATHAALYVLVIAPLINGLGHWRGRQNFTNTAYNARMLAWLTGGESLHNNHHAHPRAPKFSVRRLEFVAPMHPPGVL